jgi:hypothetical protein
MIHDVIEAEYKGDYRIDLLFDDGKRGTVDFSKYVKRGGVFKKFEDIDYFRGFQVNREIGAITWPGDLDIAPETLYAEATGAGLPSWMAETENIPADTGRARRPNRDSSRRRSR